MTEETSNTFESGSSQIDAILGTESTFLTMLTGKEDEQERIIRSSLSSLTDPTLQKLFLQSIISVLSKEGESDETDKRDAVLEILKTSSVVDLLSQNGTSVFDSYLQALGSQTKDNDPFAGSINSLLEAGVFVSPYFPQDDLSKKQLEHVIDQLEKLFTSDDEQDHIKSFRDEMLERMTLQGSRLSRVEYWRNKKLKNREIAVKLGVNDGVVEKLVTQLIEEGRLEGRRGAKRALDDTVEALRNEGLSNREIALRLHEKQSTIESSVGRLLALGLIEEREFVSPGKPKDETRRFDTEAEKLKDEKLRRFDADVKKLREKGLNNPQIADKLQCKLWKVNESRTRLIANEAIEKRPGGRSTDESTLKFDAEVKKLRDEGLGNPQIADKLKRELWSVELSVRRLIAQGEIEKRQSGRPRKETQSQHNEPDEQLGDEELNNTEATEKSEHEPVVDKGLERRRKNEERRKELDERVKQLRDEGLSNKEIAMKVGYGHTTVEGSIVRLIDSGRIVKRKIDSKIIKRSKRVLRSYKKSKNLQKQKRRERRTLEKREIVDDVPEEAIEVTNEAIHETSRQGDIESSNAVSLRVDDSVHEVPSVEVHDQVEVRHEPLEKNKSAHVESTTHEADSPREPMKKVDIEIKALFALGFQKNEVVSMFDGPLWMAIKSIKRLEKAGMIDVKYNNRQDERLRKLDKKVKPLMAEGLDADTIAQRISETADEVQRSMLRITIRKNTKK